MANTDLFFEKIKTYALLTKESEEAWTDLLKEKIYNKGDYLVNIGQTPRKVAFVCKGLFSQYYIDEQGGTVIKYFFPEGRIAGSIPATLTRTGSLFAIEAIEKTTVLEYDFLSFKNLVAQHADIARFYIGYMEKHWIIDKEPYEISLRNDSAQVRYEEFVKNYPGLIGRLKKHQIAAYLGITPTQLSRILY